MRRLFVCLIIALCLCTLTFSHAKTIARFHAARAIALRSAPTLAPTLQEAWAATGLPQSDLGYVHIKVDKRRTLWYFDPTTKHTFLCPCLKVYVRDRLLKAYPVSLGTDYINDKVQRGDRRTPEGTFYVCEKLVHSHFHRALRLSYPHEAAAERGLRAGIIDQTTYGKIEQALRTKTVPPQDTRLGGDIMIHGGGAKAAQWTGGCVACNNKAIDEVFAFVPLGTPVTILPVTQ